MYVSVSVLKGLQSARPPPLPGSTVTARDVPSGRGEFVCTVTHIQCCKVCEFDLSTCFFTDVFIYCGCEILTSFFS